MPHAAPLLRALLCLILLLNGMGYAHAATRMAAEMAASSKSATGAETSCHSDMPAMAGMAGGHHPGMDDATPQQPDAAPDCCTAGSCDGPCTQHAPVVLWPLLAVAATPVPMAAPSYRADSHPSPRLLHRLRPPISSV